MTARVRVLRARGGGSPERPTGLGSPDVVGEPGKGKWVTIYANDGHVFLEVAGIRFDTSAQGHRFALDQRVRSTEGLVARLRPVSPRLGCLGVNTPWHACRGRVDQRGASSLDPLEDPA